jgi:hypothetical protein
MLVKLPPNPRPGKILGWKCGWKIPWKRKRGCGTDEILEAPEVNLQI